MIKVMGQCVDEMRWNDNPRLVLELYSLRLTQPFVDAGELLRRLEQLEKNGGAPEKREAEESGKPSPVSPSNPPPRDPAVSLPAVPNPRCLATPTFGNAC